MPKEHTENAIITAFNLLRILVVYEDMGREAGFYELVDALGTNYYSLKRVTKVLEKMGLVTVKATEKRNLIRLTDKGRCLGRCLVKD